MSRFSRAIFVFMGGLCLAVALAEAESAKTKTAEYTGPRGVIASGGGADDHSLGPIGVDIHLWNVSDGRLIRTLEGHTGSVFSVAFSPDGRSIVSGSLDSSIRLWNVVNGRSLRTIEEDMSPIHAVAFYPGYETDGR